MGEHRGDGGIRGISKGPVIIVGLVVLMVLAVLGWFQLRDRIENQGAQAADRCVEGESVLHVTADPAIAPTVTDLAAQYTAGTPVVRDRCVRVEVASAPSQAVGAALSAEPTVPWNQQLGPRPNLWIPKSTATLEALGRPDIVSGEPRSIATSPIVLAVPRAVHAALSATPTGWQDLPALQSMPTSLEERGMPGWGDLGLALPIGIDSASTGMAVQAVAAAVSDTPAGPVTAEQLDSGNVRAAVTELSRAAPPREPDNVTTADTLADLVAHTEEADAAVHAVPTTEQQIFRMLADDPTVRVSAFLPAGATPIADHPAATIAGSDETQSRAAAQLVEFVTEPKHAEAFVDAGFRVPGTTPPADSSFDFVDIGTALAPADRRTMQALEGIVASPVPDGATTILLDESRSMSTEEGAETRLTNTAAALTAYIEKTPDTSDLGLWEYSQNLGGAAPYRIAVPTGPLSENNRRQALTDALTAAQPATGSWTYVSLAAAYEYAVENHVPGHPNSILLITDGADDQEASTRAELLSAIGEAANQDAPVRINVITIGENPAADTFRAVADRTGGTVVNVASSDGPALGEAIAKLSSQ